jgi:hypothetical protein
VILLLYKKSKSWIFEFSSGKQVDKEEIGLFGSGFQRAKLVEESDLQKNGGHRYLSNASSEDSG